MRVVVLISVLATAAAVAVADLVWEEDFSDVSDWSVIYDPGGGSSITANGGLGDMYVAVGGSEAAFGLVTAIPFDTSRKDDYTLLFTVDALTASAEYDIALDEFDSGGGWLNTIWQVFPSSGRSTFTGSDGVNLGAFTYDASTAYLKPKVDVHADAAAQTVSFDSMSMDLAPIPEPTSAVLLLVGLLGIGRVRRKMHR